MQRQGRTADEDGSGRACAQGRSAQARTAQMDGYVIWEKRGVLSGGMSRIDGTQSAGVLGWAGTDADRPGAGRCWMLAWAGDVLTWRDRAMDTQCPGEDGVAGWRYGRGCTRDCVVTGGQADDGDSSRWECVGEAVVSLQAIPCADDVLAFAHIYIYRFCFHSEDNGSKSIVAKG